MEQQLPYNPNQPKKVSLNPPAMKMGGMMAGMLIVFTLLLYIVGQAENRYLGWLTYVLIFIGLYLGTVNLRDKEMGGTINFGTAFIFGFRISLFASLILGVFYYIYFKFIAHDLLKQMLVMAEEEIMKQEMPEESMEMMMNIYKKYVFIPGSMAIGGFVGILVSGSLLSLLSAALTKRQAPPVFPSTPQ